MLSEAMRQYCYSWPYTDLHDSQHWHAVQGKHSYVRDMPESLLDLAVDSQWPAFFPSPICLVTTADGANVALEKVVGPAIVNRFPYILALSFCKQSLSERHHVRRIFTEMLERSGNVAVQFIPPGRNLNSAMNAIDSISEEHTCSRIDHSELPTRTGVTNNAPVFHSSYMVYEASLVKPCMDFEGIDIYSAPWIDVGSHRVYFLEINAIQLRQDIAEGRSQIKWRSLPAWQPQFKLQSPVPVKGSYVKDQQYQKGYTTHYSFPTAGTTGFEADSIEDGMAIKHLPPLLENQIEVDNDRARWPCFFPASVGMITTWKSSGIPNMMPCGSITVVARSPFTIACCIAYAAINVRYAPRATLATIRQTGRFGCGVPFINDVIVDAIKYAGNISIARDPEKIAHAGLEVEQSDWAPLLPALPVHFDCEVVAETRLGTHIMFIGKVVGIRVRADATPSNPLEWCPWADVVPV